MKKILVVALSFIMLLLCIVPVGAEGTDDYYAEVVLPFDLGLDNLNKLSNLEYEVYKQGCYYIPVSVIFDGKTYNYLKVGATWVYLVEQINSIDEFDTLYANGTAYDGVDVTLILLDKPSDDLMEWFRDYSKSIVYGEGYGEDVQPDQPDVYCDGTACTISDINTDGLCDTCGYPIATMALDRAYRPNKFPSNYPSVPLGLGEESHYLMVYDSEDLATYLYVFSPYDDIDMWYTYGTSLGTINIESFNGIDEVYHIRRKYLLVDMAEWSLVDDQTVKQTLVGSFEDVAIMYSTLDIYDYDGNLVFPLPLWMEQAEVTQGGMKELGMEVMKVMKVLMIVGIGLLALLILLNLFRKSFKIFKI